MGVDGQTVLWTRGAIWSSCRPKRAYQCEFCSRRGLYMHSPHMDGYKPKVRFWALLEVHASLVPRSITSGTGCYSTSSVLVTACMQQLADTVWGESGGATRSGAKKNHLPVRVPGASWCLVPACEALQVRKIRLLPVWQCLAVSGSAVREQVGKVSAELL